MIPLWLRKCLYWLLAIVAAATLKMLSSGEAGLGDFNTETLFLYLAGGPIILILDSLIGIIVGTTKSYMYKDSYTSGITHITEYNVFKEQGRVAIKLCLLRLIYPTIVLIMVILCFNFVNMKS